VSALGTESLREAEAVLLSVAPHARLNRHTPSSRLVINDPDVDVRKKTKVGFNDLKREP